MDLGVLGTLKPKITAKSVDTKKECTTGTIQNVGILYQPESSLISEAKNMSVNIISIAPTAIDDEELDDEPGDDSGNNSGGGNTGGGGDFVG